MNYSELIHQVIGPLIPRGSPIAIFGFPQSGNVGDLAIWLGQVAYLKASHPDSRIIWVSDVSSEFPPLPTQCVILLQGGGNIGDIWPNFQAMRERMLKHFSQNRIIQMPQSIHFQDQESAKRCRSVFSAHPDFHLLVRDRTSLKLADELHLGKSYLCPDMAMQLGSLSIFQQPNVDVLGLLRNDRERASTLQHAGRMENMVATDWGELTLPVGLRVGMWSDKLLAHHPSFFRRARESDIVQRALCRHYDRLAAYYLQLGCTVLGSGRVVITDRLHGHILCTLMNIPHVVLDNSYRKIRNFRDTWFTGEGLCQQAESMAEASQTAREILSHLNDWKTSTAARGGPA